MKILAWFQMRKQRIKKAQYDSGYDYAAGALLRGEKTPLSLEAEQITYCMDSFDYGMRDAIADLIRLKIIKDDRVW